MSDIVKADKPTSLEPMRQQVSVVKALGPTVLQRYSVQLQGRTYIQVAGATLIANGMGYTVRELEVKRADYGGGITGWEATAEVIDTETGQVIGRGSGIVTDDERPWASRPQFARRAMASTRAAGRALRLCMGHLYCYLGDKVAPTTAEEMPEET